MGPVQFRERDKEVTPHSFKAQVIKINKIMYCSSSQSDSKAPPSSQVQLAASNRKSGVLGHSQNDDRYSCQQIWGSECATASSPKVSPTYEIPFIRVRMRKDLS